MEPTLKSGEWWLVRKTKRVKPGQVVAFWEPGRIDLLAVKRIDRAVPGGWWVLGDNSDSSTDSRGFGAVEPTAVVGRLIWRLRTVG